MKYKKILIATLILLAILTVGAVSASEDADILAQDSNTVASLGNTTYGDEDIISADFEITEEVIPYDEPDTIVGYVAVNSVFDGGLMIYSGDTDLLNKRIDMFDLEDESRVWMDDQIHLGFTLDDVNNFDGLSDNDDITFMVASQGAQIAYSAYTIYFEENGFVLRQVNNDWDDDDDEPEENQPFFLQSPGPVDPREDSGMALILQHETTGLIDVFSLNKNRNIIENLNISTINPDDWDDGLQYCIPSNEFNFDELDNGEVFAFTFVGDDGSTCEDIFQLDKRADGNIHFHYLGPNIYIEELISGDNPVVAVLEIPINPLDENQLFVTGRLEIYGHGNFLYSEEFSEDDPTEIPIYLSDVNNFEGCEDGDWIVFEFYDNDENGLIHETRIFRQDEDGNIILEEDEYDDGDFEAEFRDANAADNGVVLIIPEDQIPEDVDDEFTILADLWGNEEETTWNINDLTLGEEGYEWTTDDLGITDMMWDIYPRADMEIRVQFYRDGEEAERAEGQVNIFNTPYINLGECGLTDPGEESAVAFAYFPEDVQDEFIISIYKDGSFFANRTFKISEMDQYQHEDDDDESFYLSLEDLGITEEGEYDLSVIFVDEDTGEAFSYNGTFNVVPFVINYYVNDEGGVFNEITEPFCRIALPEDAEGSVTIKVDGNKVFEKTLSDIGFIGMWRGPGYYIRINSLNITESGMHNAEVSVVSDEFGARNSGIDFFVNVTENTFEFRDCIYGDLGLDYHLGTPISQDSEITLYINGKKAATGGFDQEFYFDFDEGYADIYGVLKPGEYSARLEINGEVVAEDTFEVKDTSGNVNVDVVQENGTVYVNFKAPMVPYGNLDGYELDVYVDSMHPGDMYYDDGEPLLIYEGDELVELLDDETHALEIGELESGEHIVYVVYRTDWDYPLDEQDFFVRIFNVTVSGSNPIETKLTASKVTADYNSGKKITATLKDADGNPVKGADVEISVGSIDEILTTNANGKVSLSINGLNPGEYAAVISYEGNKTYAPSTKSTTVVINKASTKLEAPDVSVTYADKNGALVATLTNDAAGTIISGASVVVNVNGAKYTLKTNSNGQAKFSTADLPLGNYTASITYAGNSKYKATKTTANVAVTKTDIIISAAYDAASKMITATLTNNATGKAIANTNVKVDINGETSTAKSNSKGQVIVSNVTSGTVTISYAGNSKYNPASTTLVVSDKTDVVISADYDASNNEIVATLTNSATAKAIANTNVKVNLNGEDYTAKTNSKGQAKVSAAGLSLGTYTATISYAGNSKYNSASTTIDIAVKTKVIVTDVYAYSDRIVAKLTNGATGKFIANANMIVEINGVKYNAKSDNKGQLTLNTNDLDLPDSYDLTISYRGNDRYTPSSAKVAVDLNKANMNIKYKYNTTTKELTATLKNSKTGKTVANANMVVDINGVKTTLKSNKQGQIIFSTADYAPGTHVGTITYGGNARYNSISAAFKVDV